MKPIPFLRIIIPLLVGLCLTNLLNTKIDLFALWIIEIVLLLCYALIHRHGASLKFSFLLFDLLMINFSILIIQHSNCKNYPASLDSQINSNQSIKYSACISELPVEKQKFIKCELKLNALFTHNKTMPLNGTILAYFKKPINKSLLMPGKVLLLKSRLLKVPTPKNPMEFDYADYLSHKQIFYTSFINQESVCELKNQKSNLNFLVLIGLKIKCQIINQFKNNGLSKDAFAICSALLTGFDDEIDKSIVDAFAHSGTLHVLSVSGLHVGLIYLILNFLFNLFDPYQKYKRIRLFVMSVLLWIFALISGFSPPVLRAVLMFNLLGIGKNYYRSGTNNQLNVLFFTAFVLLIYNPNFIFDIGFLLSYTAMIGIIVFSPMLLTWLNIKNKIALYFYESIAVSIAATITTLPLTLYYFKQFPIWFFLCNLVVVPLSFLILILAFLSLFKLTALIQIVNLLVNWMIQFIQIFNHGRYTYIDFIPFSLSDALFLFVIILTMYFLIKERKFFYALTISIVIIFWQLHSLIEVYKAKQSKFMTVYQVKNKSRILIKNKGDSNYNQFDSLSFNYNLKPHFISFIHSKKLVKEFNYLKSGNDECLILNKNAALPQTSFQKVNTIILTNNFVLDEKLLNQFKSLKMVVADGSNQPNINYKTENLCCKFAIPFQNTATKGAYTMVLK